MITDVLYDSMNSQAAKTEPDPDTIKMFVGQIPRSMDENDLRKMFEEFGPIFQLNVLRDKVSGQSKGCCFITFFTRKSAVEAQNALHNIKTMPGMQHPIQMKPADSEKRNEERKLFIGMLAKKCSENDVRMMFAPFGTIDECTVLREQNGQSKGCAFVTYASKQCAQNCIKALHHSQTMEGCRSPLVVKFADTQKEKEIKKLQQQLQQNAGLLGVANLANLGNLTPQYLALLQQAAASGNVGALGNVGNLGMGLNALQLQQILTAAASAATALQNNPGDMNNLQNLQGLAALAAVANNPALSSLSPQNLSAVLQQQLINANTPSSAPNTMQGINTTGTSSASPTTGSFTSANNSNSMGAIGGLGSMHNNLSSMTAAQGIGSHMGNALNGLGNNSNMAAAASGQASIDALSQAYSGIQQYAGLSGLLGQASFPNAFASQTSAQLQQAASNAPAGKQTEGPEGANLFIYHLPQEFGDHDLMQMFMPFGNVVSAKVFIDKQTNLSKCFGFVSYDNPVSAQAAIQSMNGFQIGMKRLKVQLKRPKSESKPY